MSCTVVAENGAKEHRVDRLVWRGGVEGGQTGLGRKAGAPLHPPQSRTLASPACVCWGQGVSLDVSVL